MNCIMLSRPQIRRHFFRNRPANREIKSNGNETIATVIFEMNQLRKKCYLVNQLPLS